MAHPDPQPRSAAARRRWLPVLVIAAALLVAGIAAQGAGLSWQEGELPTSTGEAPTLGPLQPESQSTLPSELPTGEPRDGFTLPAWVTWLILGVLLGIPVALVLTLLARRLIDWLVHAPESDGEPEPETQYLHRDFSLVEDAVAAALAEMDLGNDPRSAIMACWVHFERASEAVGIERDGSDTPADLVGRLLERHRLDGAALARLTEAYLRARYSPHDVVEADRDQARDALVALQSQLGVRGTR
ncbi:DUF4129 domain-containing protein [Glycomyces harbinensis]|uniref:Protein-glutamine gamma-glutamyltransferase-like C-terminal domain-containing protein n=1 Tax=Glycomyces harbinensis TaxID=58114 RepID=A0A1G6USH0_9ACTN|nr:DUF4129 domain-containing protein [Glycomyces harbinensis]SDD44328.1 protein of unknown function [Glycomyces harbinensis]